MSDFDDGSRTRHYVTDAAGFDPGDRQLVEVDGLEVLVVNVAGEVHAVANYCIHQSGPLSDGHISGHITAEESADGWDYRYTCEDRLIACPWHGWQFDLTTGDHIGDDDFRLPTFETVVEDGEIFVEL